MLRETLEATGFIHKGEMSMTKTIDKVQRTTTTPNEERLNQLKQLFPECLTEGEVDALKVMEQLNICKAGGGGRG